MCNRIYVAQNRFKSVLVRSCFHLGSLTKSCSDKNNEAIVTAQLTECVMWKTEKNCASSRYS